MSASLIVRRSAAVRVVAQQAGGAGRGGRPRGRPRKKDGDGAGDPPKPVFLNWPGPKEISMAELKEAYTACHRLRGGERDACYLVHGLDSAAMERYFPIVDMLETCFLGVPTVPRNVMRQPPKRRPWHLPGMPAPPPPSPDADADTNAK